MTREDRLKAVEICSDLIARCCECPLYKLDGCEVIVALTKENEALRSSAEERKARWKGAGMGDYYCSLCQHQISGRTKFCPECGAKMDEGEDDKA